MVCTCSMAGTPTCDACRAGREDKVNVSPAFRPEPVSYDKLAGSLDMHALAEIILDEIARRKQQGIPRDCYKPSD